MKSIELNWIRRKCDKSLIMPEVVFYPLANASGLYYEPDDKELYDVDGKPHSMMNGVIVINPEFDDIPSIIAHEWRHHWQYFHGMKFDNKSWNYLDKKFGYNKALLMYFKTSKTETDALRFQYKYSGMYDEWIKPLHTLIKDLIVKKPMFTYVNNKVTA